MYDDDGNEITGEQVPQEPQQSGLDRLTDSIYNYQEKRDQRDVDAIKNRAKNDGVNSRKSGNEEETSSGKKSGLDKKDSLDAKDNKNKGKASGKGNTAAKGGKNAAKSATNKVKSGKDGIFANKWKKIKIKIYIVAAIAGTFLTVLMIGAIAGAVEEVLGSIASFFGITEDVDDETGEEGLLSNEEYIYKDGDPDGERYTQEELVQYLKDNNTCTKNTVWTDIKAFFMGNTHDACATLRYIKNTIEEAEKKPGLILDRSLILSTIFYGYASQPDYDDYNNKDNVEIVNTTDHFKVLKELLSNKDTALTAEDVENLIANSYISGTYQYYTWEIEHESNSDGTETKTIGVCKKVEINYNTFDLDKWKTFMRYGDDAAVKYQDVLLYQKAYESTDEFCNGSMTKSELLAIVEASTPSGSTASVEVDEAINKFKNGAAPSVSPFLQSANIDNGIKDIINDFTSTNFGTVVLDYKNGFAYKRFPGFQKAIDNSNIKIEYDEILTPKVIEHNIQDIISKKGAMNNVLDYPDLGNSTYLNGADIRYSVVKGAYCGDYLTSELDNIMVNLKDCDGNPIDVISFEDYIIGVANGEVSNTEDDYVLSEMVAAISFALRSSSNYSKGNLITMRSGNCAQAYCSMLQGCTAKASSVSCGSFNCTSYIPGGTKKYPDLYSKYQQLYNEAKDFLIVSGDTIHNVHYYSSNQKEWEKKAKAGMSFTQIIQEEYSDAELIQCSKQVSSSDTDIDDQENLDKKVGNTKSDEYPNVARDLGKYYGFSYAEDGDDITVNPEWSNVNIKAINSACVDGGWTNEYYVNTQGSSNFSSAFSKICVMITKGIKLEDGTTCKIDLSNMTGGETITSKKSSTGTIPSSIYGISQTWNSGYSIAVNGKTYYPYGVNAATEYNNFVNAIGKEEDCRNINYIFYKYAYKDAGFNWDKTNPKLFELKY